MDRVWYYTKDGEEKFGPYTDEELRRLVGQKIILPDDRIWMPALDEWIRLGDSVYCIFIPED
ncbi:MAG: DUF4339 domain-containing protein [Solobacterium sp.]|nr:DUF4339 domain-containing protein [Solobacterium sp.]